MTQQMQQQTVLSWLKDAHAMEVGAIPTLTGHAEAAAHYPEVRAKLEAHAWERRAYRILALATVTTWGVYPLGYLVPAFFPEVSFNWLHIAFNVADVVNKVGAGVVIYIGAANVLEDRVPKDATQDVREVA